MSNQIKNAICQQILTFIIDTESENHTALKTHSALWCHTHDSCILFNAKFQSQERSKITDFYKRSYQPIPR